MWKKFHSYDEKHVLCIITRKQLCNDSSVTVTAVCFCGVLTCELVKLWPLPSPPPLASRCLCEVNGRGENRTSVLHCPGKWAGKWGAGNHTPFSGPAALPFWPVAVALPLDPCCLNTAAMYEFSRVLKQAHDLSLCPSPPLSTPRWPHLTGRAKLTQSFIQTQSAFSPSQSLFYRRRPCRQL